MVSKDILDKVQKTYTTEIDKIDAIVNSNLQKIRDYAEALSDCTDETSFTNDDVLEYVLPEIKEYIEIFNVLCVEITKDFNLWYKVFIVPKVFKNKEIAQRYTKDKIKRIEGVCEWFLKEFMLVCSDLNKSLTLPKTKDKHLHSLYQEYAVANIKFFQHIVDFKSAFVENIKEASKYFETKE